MLHTIQDAMTLTGLTRKSLYNHMDAGRVSYSIGADGRRYFETSELERAYGKLTTVIQITQPPGRENTQPYTPAPESGELAKLIEDAVQRATAPLVAEIAELRATLMRIEHKPDAPAAPAPGIDQVQQPTPPASKVKPQSFADLLSGLE